MNIRHCFYLLIIPTLLGCGERKTPPASAAASKENPSPAAETPVLSGSDAAALGIDAPRTEADRAWAEVEKALEAPGFPPEWQLQEPSKEQIAEFQRKNAEVAAKAADRAREFYTKYADHAKAAEAREHEHELLTVASQLGNTNITERLDKLEKARLADPNLSEDDRLQLRMQQVQRKAAAKAGEDMNVLLTELEAEARNLQKEFPKRTELSGLLLQIAEARLGQGETEKSRKLVQEIVDSKPEDESKQGAEQLLARLNRVGKPLNIKFTAVDGRDVDVANMKGKVVLVDFWATWCGPCMAELPNVKATYEKLRGKGFEIVGVSFDQDIDKLKRVVEREKMTWPQYFEKDGDSNKFGEEFGIKGIPTMWLVDKKGVLRDLNGRDKLAEKVEKLLLEN